MIVGTAGYTEFKGSEGNKRMVDIPHDNAGHYFVPEPSSYPIRGSLALLLLAMGAVLWMNQVAAGPWMTLAGFAVLIWMLFGWFGMSTV